MSEKTTIKYKIRNKDSGLFSTGGSYPSFTKSGKTWGNLGMLRRHLGLDKRLRHVYADCELVEIMTIEVEQPTDTTLADLFDDQQKRAEKRRAESAVRVARWKKEQALRQLQDAQRTLAELKDV